jgi:hypothetical protein
MRWISVMMGEKRSGGDKEVIEIRGVVIWQRNRKRSVWWVDYLNRSLRAELVKAVEALLDGGDKTGMAIGLSGLETSVGSIKFNMSQIANQTNSGRSLK